MSTPAPPVTETEVVPLPRTPSAWTGALEPDSVIRNVISFIIRKGGAGKTTLILLLADAFSRFGLNVLLIDTDPQGNLSMGVGCKVNLVSAGEDRFHRVAQEPDRDTVIEVIDSGEPGVASLAVMEAAWTAFREDLVNALWDRGGPLSGGRFGTIGIIPSYEAIEGSAKQWTTPKDLKRLQRTLLLGDAEGNPAPNTQWDVVLIDTPPGGTDIPIQATQAAQYAMMVSQAGKFGMEAIPKTVQFVNDIRDNYDHGSLKLLGLVLNEFDPRMSDQAAHADELEAAARTGVGLGLKLWHDRLPHRTVIGKAQSAEAPLSAFLSDYSQRRPATVICKAVEGIGLGILDEIGHPRARHIRSMWEAAWPREDA